MLLGRRLNQLAVGNNIAIGSWLSHLDSYSNKLPVITVLKRSLGGAQALGGGWASQSGLGRFDEASRRLRI